MMVFALLMIVPQTAMLLGRESRQKTLDRLRISNLNAVELLVGVCLSQLVIAAVQVGLVFLVAVLLGFHNQGSLLQAMLVGMVLAFGSIGMGLLTACFVSNDSQAANVGSTIAMFQVFLSGSFYVLPPITIFTLFGHQIDAFDILPATHGFMALQATLSYGAGLGQISFRLGCTAMLSVLFFVLGIWTFHRLKMSPSTR
jgi:ABC-type multidrug transport system permease subunit